MAATPPLVLVAPGHHGTGGREKDWLCLSTPPTSPQTPAALKGTGWEVRVVWMPKGTERSKPVQKILLRTGALAVSQTTHESCVTFGDSFLAL